jgi:hypothetical protein
MRRTDLSDFEIGDCPAQRSLDESGRTRALSTGMWLRTQGI